MGTTPSRPPAESDLGHNQAAIVKLMMPIFFSKEPLTDEEYAAAQDSWTAIANDTAPGFVEKRKDKSFSHTTCVSYFNRLFFYRLFDTHPLAKDLFKDVTKKDRQAKLLVSIISLALSERADPEKYERTLVSITQVHNERGIKAVEYGIVGDVILWTIGQCLSPVAYTETVHNSWVKIVSRMLRTMVPLAVAYELRDGTNQQRRMEESLRLPEETSVFLATVSSAAVVSK